MEINKLNIKYPKNSKEVTLFISFPRTGCHWFRNFAELTLERPCHPHSSYYNNKPWGVHYHGTKHHRYHYDLPDKEDYKNLLIMDRKDIARTLFSYILLEGKPLNNANIIIYYTLYLEHKEKWENFSKSVDSKIVYYEDLLYNDIDKLQEVLYFLSDKEIEKDKIYKTLNFLTKEKTKETLQNNHNQIKIDKTYEKLYIDSKSHIQEIILNY